MSVKRFGVSLEENILKKLDKIVDRQLFPNRSQALRALINEHQSNLSIVDNEQVSGAVILIYNHNIKRIQTEITSLKHEYNCMFLSSQHIHLDSKNSIETVVLLGSAKNFIKLSNKLLAIKGLTHGNFVISAIN